MNSTDRDIHESSENYTNGVKIRQEERVPSWGVVHGGVIRHMEFHNMCNGRTFKVVVDSENTGTDAPVQKITADMELGVEHLDVLIETLTNIRADQARRAREESDWHAAQAAKQEI